MKYLKIDDAAMRLTDIIRGSRANSLEEILEIVASDFDLKYIAYIRFASHSDRRIVSTIVTYPSEWQSCYFEKAYVNIDPVVAYGCELVTPFDWDELKSSTSIVAAFFNDATAHDIAATASRFQFGTERVDFGWFPSPATIRRTSGLYIRKKIWPRSIRSRGLLICCKLQQKGACVHAGKLSQEERDCLALFAKGKIESHIAEELGLSITEVILYLDTARHKLRCINVTQAVAVAIAMEAIPFDFRD